MTAQGPAPEALVVDDGPPHASTTDGLRRAGAQRWVSAGTVIVIGVLALLTGLRWVDADRPEQLPALQALVPWLVLPVVLVLTFTTATRRWRTAVAAAALRTLGASEPHVFVYGVVPGAAGRFAAYALYRWEVALRETVIVGLVGAGGLGRLLAQQLAAFDHAGALATVVALIMLSAAVDLVSQTARRSLR